jgi:hypothetical protein
MAGDWMKMRMDLFTHPKVVRISSALKADNLRTVGGLMSAWCLFDVHSESGFLSGYTLETIDYELRWPGFAQEMCAVGWLEVVDGGLLLPRFDTHNGQSAKRRAMDAERKRDVRKTSASEADKLRTREEKRREEKDKPLSTTPTSADGFANFWQAWPKSTRKVAKDQCAAKWKAKGCEGIASQILEALEAFKSCTEWASSSGQFIPAPLVWLNQSRWEASEALTDDSQTQGFI